MLESIGQCKGRSGRNNPQTWAAKGIYDSEGESGSYRIGDPKCYQTILDMHWPDGVTCPRCSSESVIKNGRADTEPHRQRYECKGCRHRFDDLTDSIFAGHQQPLRTWIACLYLMGLNLSGLQIAQELEINKDDARAMISQLRQGIVDRRTPVVLKGERGRRTLAKEKPPVAVHGLDCLLKAG